ncbi:Porphobilinogen deaminase [Komagataella phaffii CBS 7435]|nr:GQ67_01870T0 [Komagataella phaffii]AOA66696.1 GQ68_01885T0 [Komagataella phaffii GS115]CAH2446963.1 Porphobilinogen deaminase [Komagataella phaffii CBS 7435]CCA37218.1 Porphobilinogen deaminase [Komagataella phaffii CBS 7435]
MLSPVSQNYQSSTTLLTTGNTAHSAMLESYQNMNQIEQSGPIDCSSLKLGSRKSALAIIQAEIVRQLILKEYPELETKLVSVSTLGDQVQNKALFTFGGKSLWTKELEMLLLESVGGFDQIDMIVHSLKDMPTHLPDEFELGCIIEREDPRDALVVQDGLSYKSLADLPEGAVVGTSSVRRSAQLLKNFPHLKFKSVRGNLQTRLRKLDDPDSEYCCLLLAAAGLIRTGLQHRISMYLNDDVMYHSVGQGALGVEIRKGDQFMKNICEKIGHRTTTLRCLAERALLRYLEGGCSVPIGVSTIYSEDTKELTMNSLVVSCNGRDSVTESMTEVVTTEEQAEDFGERLAQKLIDQGAKRILDEINFNKIKEIKEEGLH